MAQPEKSFEKCEVNESLSGVKLLHNSRHLLNYAVLNQKLLSGIISKTDPLPLSPDSLFFIENLQFINLHN